MNEFVRDQWSNIIPKDSTAAKPYDEQDLTQDKILELALHHPMIFNYVRFWREGKLTWEQVNYAIILSLVDRNTDLMKDLLALSQKATPGITINLSDVDSSALSQLANLPRKKKPCTGDDNSSDTSH